MGSYFEFVVQDVMFWSTNEKLPFDSSDNQVRQCEERGANYACFGGVSLAKRLWIHSLDLRDKPPDRITNAAGITRFASREDVESLDDCDVFEQAIAILEPSCEDHVVRHAYLMLAQKMLVQDKIDRAIEVFVYALPSLLNIYGEGDFFLLQFVNEFVSAAESPDQRQTLIQCFFEHCDDHHSLMLDGLAKLAEYIPSDTLRCLAAKKNLKSDFSGNSMLHELVENDNALALTRYLDCGADTEVTNNENSTPLHLAVGKPRLVAILLNYGAHPDRRNNYGQRPSDALNLCLDLQCLAAAAVQENEKFVPPLLRHFVHMHHN